MPMHILKTSNIMIKLGISNVSDKFWIYAFHNTFQSQLLYSMKALHPSCFSRGPFLVFHMGTLSLAFALRQRFPQGPPLPYTSIQCQVCTLYF